MSRPRRHVHEDLSYSHWHRQFLPDLYDRIGHRFDVVDRDWTEYCHRCREPLVLVETVRDVGQNLADKNTRVLRRLAELAGLDAYLVAYRVDRPKEVQRIIDEHEREVRRLELEHPIVGFRVRKLSPRVGPLVSMTPEQWAGFIAGIHVHHYRSTCPRPEVAASSESWHLMGTLPLWFPTRMQPRSHG